MSSNKTNSNQKTPSNVGLKVVLVGVSIFGILVAYFVIQMDTKTAYDAIDPFFKNPFSAITIIGVLSLVVSLIVFSVGTNVRASLSKDIDVNEIRNNLKGLKNDLGEPTFTNLINGLPLAAKEELLFPEPIGVLRHKEFRRALTISVALVYFAVVGFSVADTEAANKLNDNPVIQSFAWVFVAIIAFYFGDKIFENYVKSKGVQPTNNVLEPMTIEEAKISKDEKKLKLKIKNNLKSKIKVVNILVDDASPDGFTAFDIEGGKSVSKEYEIKGGQTVKVEVGQVTAEKEIKTEEVQVENGKE